MTPEEFKQRWEANGDLLAPIPADELVSTEIPASAREFLALAGLPWDTAPFLSFDPRTRGHASDFIRIAMNRPAVMAVGSNGAGDPVAIRPDGTLVYLNQDAGFAEFYINKDIETFAEASLRMRDLIDTAQKAGGPDAYLDGLIPRALWQDFQAFLEANDPRALEPGALWFEEIAGWAAEVR